MEVAELRSLLKPLGFKVKVQTLSHGKHAILTDLTGTRKLTGNVFTEETLSFWKPAIEVCRAAGQVTSDTDKVYGLKF